MSGREDPAAPANDNPELAATAEEIQSWAALLGDRRYSPAQLERMNCLAVRVAPPTDISPRPRTGPYLVGDV